MMRLKVQAEGDDLLQTLISTQDRIDALAPRTTFKTLKDFVSSHVSQLFVGIRKEGRVIRAFFKTAYSVLISLSLTLFVAAFVLLLFICYLMVDLYQLAGLSEFFFYVASS
jgi:hypothetical protein